MRRSVRHADTHAHEHTVVALRRSGARDRHGWRQTATKPNDKGESVTERQSERQSDRWKRERERAARERKGGAVGDHSDGVTTNSTAHEHDRRDRYLG